MHLFLLCCFQSLLISSILLVICQEINNIRYRNLEYNIHTALQVKTKTDLCFKAFLVRVEPQILYRILIILSRNRVFNRCCLTIIEASREWLRKLLILCFAFYLIVFNYCFATLDRRAKISKFSHFGKFIPYKCVFFKVLGGI